MALKEMNENGGINLGGAGAIVETLPPEALREFLSLQLGYNLLIPRQKFLLLEIDRLKAEMDSLEKVFTDNSLKLSLFQERLVTAEQTYQSLLAQYRGTKSQVNNLKLILNTLRPRVAYQEVERDRLESNAGKLKYTIANLELERVRLDRKIAVYKSTFDKFAGLLENARVAKANRTSDVKIVARAVEAVGLSPKLLTTIAIFGMVGGFGAVFLAFILENVEKARGKMG